METEGEWGLNQEQKFTNISNSAKVWGTRRHLDNK